MSRPEYNPDWIPPPGATIEDLICRREKSKSRALIVKHLGEMQTGQLLGGEIPIDSDLAAFLADSVGLSASFWLERERLYRAALRQRISETQLLEELPLDDLRKRAFIKPVYSHAETVAEVVKFFGTNDAETCSQHIHQLPGMIMQKASRAIVSSRGSLAAWVRAGEIEANQMECANWNRDRLRELLPAFRKLTRIEDPEKYLPQIKSLCKSCGIAFVVQRALNRCSARGVMKFISPIKVMVLLSYRHLTDDQFWFSVFHEMAHLLLHAEDNTIIDDWDDSVTAKELEADRFAADALIPLEFQNKLHSLRDDRSIIRFARRIGVSRGIVVGQLQHRGILGYERFNHLKIYYQWNDRYQIERRLKPL